MRALYRHADNRLPNSPANRFRRRRMRLFAALCEGLPRPLRILDLGGVEHFWRYMGFADRGDVEIVLLDPKPLEPQASNISAVVGDARDLGFVETDEYPIVFSNSVIEHVGDWSDQQRMASELRRVGRRYFVQTPNRYFPVEPHFFFPGFQFLPLRARVELVRHFALGYHDALPDPEAARAAVTEIRLLTAAEVRALFPGGRLYRERIAGLTKSLIAFGGWERERL